VQSQFFSALTAAALTCRHLCRAVPPESFLVSRSAHAFCGVSLPDLSFKTFISRLCHVTYIVVFFLPPLLSQRHSFGRCCVPHLFFLAGKSRHRGAVFCGEVKDLLSHPLTAASSFPPPRAAVQVLGALPPPPRRAAAFLTSFPSRPRLQAFFLIPLVLRRICPGCCLVCRGFATRGTTVLV